MEEIEFIEVVEDGNRVQIMTSNHQENQTGQKKGSFLLEILTIGFLILGLFLFQWINQDSSVDASATPTIQINLPTVQYPTIPPSAPEFTVPIQGIGAPEITGTVTFRDIAGTVAILLHVEGLPAEEEGEEGIVPAELHHGTCAAPGPLAHPMTAPDAGESETDLAINLQQFNAQKPMAVILYRSPQDHTAIACADVS